MPKRRFSEELYQAILKDYTNGATVAEICRRYGISRQSFYRWKAKHLPQQTKARERLRRLEEENARLKRLVAEQLLDIQRLRDMLRLKD